MSEESFTELIQRFKQAKRDLYKLKEQIIERSQGMDALPPGVEIKQYVKVHGGVHLVKKEESQ